MLPQIGPSVPGQCARLVSIIRGAAFGTRDLLGLGPAVPEAGEVSRGGRRTSSDAGSTGSRPTADRPHVAGRTPPRARRPGPGARPGRPGRAGRRAQLVREGDRRQGRLGRVPQPAEVVRHAEVGLVPRRIAPDQIAASPERGLIIPEAPRPEATAGSNSDGVRSSPARCRYRSRARAAWPVRA